jgi:RNA polymerase sigma-70 factor (ECF subfamily)
VTSESDWSDLYRALYPDLVRFLHAKVWDMDRAEELAQETFVRALRQRPDNPRAWLFTVASNLAKDEARTVVRRKKHLTLLKTETPEHTDTTPMEALQKREEADHVRRALDALSERDREVLLLWNAGLNYDEIAEQAGLSVGAIGTTLSRARKRLVAAYSEGGEAHVART